MKHYKKVLIIPLFTLISFVLIACGGSNPSSPSSNSPNRYTLTFNSNSGSSVSSITTDEGIPITKPIDPTKSNYFFDDWYFDSKLTDLVNWPLTLTNNTTVYAKWTEARDYFLTARDATINSDQFEYTFHLATTLAYGSFAGPSAKIDGNVKYNTNSTNSYYKYEESSGLLLANSKTHTIKTGTELAVFKTNPEGQLYSYEKSAVPVEFRYDSSSYAKALFEFEKDQIKELTLVDGNKYDIKYSGSATGVINSAIRFLDNPILQMFIDLPDSDSNLHTYVTFANGLIDTFEYEFTISVLSASITFHYELDFSKIGNGVVINIPTFPGISITQNEIDAQLATINQALDSYKNLANSGYSYDVKTKVDFPGKNAIDAHVQGRTMRQVVGDDIFFWNRIEFDSDYKNTDLYSSLDIKDYERYRVSYANKDVYDVIDGALLNTYTKIEGYDNHLIDNYYFLIDSSLLTFSNISIIQESIANNVTTFSLGLKQAGVLSILEFIDDSIRVDVNAENEIVIYDINSGLEIKGCDFKITLTDDALTSIEIKLNGAYNANSYVDTQFSGACSFSLEYNLTTDTKGATYTAPTKNSEVDLSNN